MSKWRCQQRSILKSVFVGPLFELVVCVYRVRASRFRFYCVCCVVYFGVCVCASANLYIGGSIFVQFLYKTGIAGIGINRLDIVAWICRVSCGQFQLISVNFCTKKCKQICANEKKNTQERKMDTRNELGGGGVAPTKSIKQKLCICAAMGCGKCKCVISFFIYMHIWNYFHRENYFFFMKNKHNFLHSHVTCLFMISMVFVHTIKNYENLP